MKFNGFFASFYKKKEKANSFQFKASLGAG
jgi:hypothetical protein